jgi:hypothetical protein
MAKIMAILGAILGKVKTFLAANKKLLVILGAVTAALGVLAGAATVLQKRFGIFGTLKRKALTLAEKVKTTLGKVGKKPAGTNPSDDFPDDFIGENPDNDLTD